MTEIFHWGLTAAGPFFASMGLCLLIILTRQWHGNYSMDQLTGVQRVHDTATPRIGGLAIIFALGIGVLLSEGESRQILRMVFILGFVVFSFGFTEDITKRVSVALRLWASFMPAVIAYFLTGTTLHHIGWAPLDYLLAFTPFAIIFTAFAVGGLTQAINIIDGFNGLCSWVAIWVLCAIMIIAWRVGDMALAAIFPLIIASILGFLVFNWPLGKIFLGDGGSYLLGLCVAWSSVLLATRNSSVSPFALFLISVYPITEVLFSMYRRKRSKQATGQPDMLHLHQLIAMTYIYPRCNFVSRPVYKNSMTGLLISLFTIGPALFAIVFYDQQEILLLMTLVFIVLYRACYQWVARRAPRAFDMRTSSP